MANLTRARQFQNHTKKTSNPKEDSYYVFYGCINKKLLGFPSWDMSQIKYCCTEQNIIGAFGAVSKSLDDCIDFVRNNLKCFGMMDLNQLVINITSEDLSRILFHNHQANANLTRARQFQNHTKKTSNPKEDSYYVFYGCINKKLLGFPSWDMSQIKYCCTEQNIIGAFGAVSKSLDDCIDFVRNNLKCFGMMDLNQLVINITSEDLSRILFHNHQANVNITYEPVKTLQPLTPDEDTIKNLGI
ncbi:hypothetical protein RF11_12217 [Thelohanellus kitauei]|uniref:Uncharacterized protein n=1 Tax=Thelohanellus kitauei TaxID=669202 RepID=A0A0C2N247_THEKT|nr:hypothetical protein RF11_12217 [Thelohanellus kitauei]